MLNSFSSLAELREAVPDEQSAIDIVIAIRWKRGAFCPHCRSTNIYHFRDGRTHKCADCRKRFSIRAGTIFADSKLPLRTWLTAIWLITANKKGISSTQLARELGITQKSAWFLSHRLRCAADSPSFAERKMQEVQPETGFLEKPMERGRDWFSCWRRDGDPEKYSSWGLQEATDR